MSNKYILHIREGDTCNELSSFLNFSNGRDFTVKIYSDDNVKTICDFLSIYNQNSLISPDLIFPRGHAYISKATNCACSTWGPFTI